MDLVETICLRCNGEGYIEKYRHVQNGICFLCWGSGRRINNTSYPKLNLKLRELARNEDDSYDEDLIKQIQNNVKEYLFYETLLQKAQAEKDEDAIYYYNVQMNKIITSLHSLNKKKNK